MQIRLRDYIQGDRGWGSIEGRRVRDCLLSVVQANPQVTVFRISLSGMRQTDTSFARESVVVLAKSYAGQHGFCLVDVPDEDVLDNWDAVARKQEFPLIVWDSLRPRLIGKQPSEGVKPMLDFVLSVEATTASEAAARLRISVPNASNKLKLLCSEGYILRREQAAPSGGIEFAYFPIR